LPGGVGTIKMAPAIVDETQVLRVRCTTRRKYEATVTEIMELAREILAAESLYKGKALRMVFRESFFEGKFSDVRFMDLRGVAASDLVFSRVLQQAIETNIWT